MMEGDESIYQMIVASKTAAQRPPRYVSKYPGILAPTGSTFGPSTATQVPVTNLAGAFNLQRPVHDHCRNGLFGPGKSGRQVPDQFLKKGSGAARIPAPAATEAYLRRHIVRIPPIVHRTDQPISGLTTTRDYIKSNAITAILSDPVIRPNPSLENYFCMGKHKSFGSVPAYLRKVQAQIEKEELWIRGRMEESEAKAKSVNTEFDVLPEEERVQLLSGLKQKWQEVNHQYQSMTHIVKIDTISKVRMKERYESMLSQLEKDIDRLSKGNVIIRRDTTD